MTDDQKTVTVPRWALQFVMDYACFQDRGPDGEGWRSDEMERATDALERALEEPNESRTEGAS